MSLTLISTNRKEWVDALRGLAILFVIYGHCVKLAGRAVLPEFFIYTTPIKMPLFFAISGYVFNANKGWSEFLGSTFWKLIVPWLILGFTPILAMVPFLGIDYGLNYFLEMLSGKVLWFMPCFIIAEVIFYIISRYCKKTMWITVAAFFCFILGMFLHRKGILNYAMFNRALVVQIYFLIGYFFCQYEKRITAIQWSWLCLAVILYIVLCYTGTKLFANPSFDIHLNKYYNIPYCLTLIFLGCTLCFTLASKASIRSKTMSFIGQNTLIMYIWHGLFISLLIKGISLLGWIIPVNWWTSLIKTAWACVTCGICAILFNNFLPIVVGKKRNKDAGGNR